jgi:hypothetical protein
MTTSKISGQVYVWVPEEGNTVEIAVENTGPNLIGLTHNYFPTKAQVMDVHDDHGRYGHGM